MAVNEDGYREVIGTVEGMQEGTENWRNFLTSLTARGLRRQAVHRRPTSGTSESDRQRIPACKIPTLRSVFFP